MAWQKNRAAMRAARLLLVTLLACGLVWASAGSALAAPVAPSDQGANTYARTRFAAVAALIAGAAAIGAGIWLLRQDGEGVNCARNQIGDRVCMNLRDTAHWGWASVAGGSVLLGSGGAGLLTIRW